MVASHRHQIGNKPWFAVFHSDALTVYTSQFQSKPIEDQLLYANNQDQLPLATRADAKSPEAFTSATNS
jgi:hypothetical protein